MSRHGAVSIDARESEPTATGRDVVSDFAPGDLIDLSGFDANAGLAGAQVKEADINGSGGTVIELVLDADVITTREPSNRPPMHATRSAPAAGCSGSSVQAGVSCERG